MKTRLLACSCALILTTVPVVRLEAADGVLLVQRTTSGTDVRTSQVQVEKTRIRTDMVDPSGAAQIVIFDGAKQVLDLVNMDRKTYTEITKAEVDRMAGQMQAMMAQMNGLPEAQRAQMDAMMRGRGMPGMTAPVKTEYRRNGTDRVGRWTCDKYDGYQNGQKTSEVCTVTAAALGIGATDLDVTRQLADFFATVMPQMSQQVMSVGRADAQGFAGFPVKTVSTIAGKTYTMEITEASRQTFPDSLFAIPTGFVKQDMMGGRGR